MNHKNSLNDPEVVAAFDADVPVIQFPTECTPEIREAIDTLATKQDDTTDAISHLEVTLSDSTQDLRDELTNSTTSIRDHINAVADSVNKAISGIATEAHAPSTSQSSGRIKVYDKPWLMMLVAIIPTLLIYMASVRNHAAHFDNSTLDTLEQLILSDDYVEYMEEHALQRHCSERTLSDVYGLKPLPQAAIEAPSINDQRKSIIMLHAWRDNLSDINTRYLVTLLIFLVLPWWLHFAAIKPSPQNDATRNTQAHPNS
ncbi:MAG: hypothetical protein LIP02_03250 [Bacteroidales bacterium]|nr:hypothetical protein [Bacteroidales bacterium]